MKSSVIQVKTYGRTGSNLITNYFATVGYESLNSHDSDKIKECLAGGRPLVIHDHSYDYVIPNVVKQSVCLFLKRRNTTEQLLSMIVAKHLNFFHDMDTQIAKNDREKPTEIEKFILDKQVCLFEARVFTEWHYNAAITLANSSIPYITAYYEDYINDMEYFSFLHRRSGFKLMTYPEKKNSIQFTNVIENYEEVIQWLIDWNLSNGVYND